MNIRHLILVLMMKNAPTHNGRMLTVNSIQLTDATVPDKCTIYPLSTIVSVYSHYH